MSISRSLRAARGGIAPLLFVSSVRGALIFFGAGFVMVSSTTIACLVWNYVGKPPLILFALVAVLMGSLIAVNVMRISISHSEACPSAIDLVLSAAVITVYALPVLLASFLMGVGTYPKIFFNIDTPYYLSQAHALTRFDQYPPPSLNNLGYVVPYHYGVQAAAAFISRLTTAAVHKSLFWIVVPLLVIAKLGVAWRIGSLAFERGVPLVLSLLALLFIVDYPLYWIQHLGSVSTARPSLFTLETFGTGLQILSTIASSFILFGIALLILDRTMKYRLFGIAILVGSIPLFKSPHLIAGCLLVGAWALVESTTQRTWGPILTSVLAVLLALIVAQMSVDSGTYRFDFLPWLAVPPEYHTYAWNVVSSQAPNLLAALALIALCLFRFGWAAGKLKGIGPFITVGAGLLTIPFVIVMLRQNTADMWEVDYNFLQLIDPGKVMLPIAVLMAMIGLVKSGPLTRALVVIVLLGLTGLPLFAKLNDSLILLTRPQEWHEFASNEAIGPALKIIPIEASVIAINDLRYPAQKYRRDLRQFQIAALFGHQAYASVPGYERLRESLLRVEEQKLLQRKMWSTELDVIACHKGWTHVLLFKQAPHVAAVPGKLLYESPAYATYALRDCQDGINR